MIRRRVLVALLAGLPALVGTVGCGDGGTASAPSTAPSPAPPPTPVPTTVSVTPKTPELLAPGKTLQLAAEVRDQSGRVMTGVLVTWASSDDLAARVDEMGLVTAVAGGATTITAMAGEASGTTTIIVIEQPGLEDLNVLLDGVSGVAAPGPSVLCVYGPDAFPVVSGSPLGAVPAVRAPAVAAGRWQSGRVVAYGDGAHFHEYWLAMADTGRLMRNALFWAAGDGVAEPRIGVAGERELLVWLRNSGHDVAEVTLTPDSLGQVDVVAVAVWNQTPREIEALSAFVRTGGGLVMAEAGWGWADQHPDLDLIDDFAGNRLLASVGIQWSREFLEGTSPRGFAVSGPPPPLTHAGVALETLETQSAGGRTLLSEPELAQALDSVVRAAACLPPGDTLLAPRLRALLAGAEHRWPSATEPVGMTDAIARLAATVFAVEQRRTPAGLVRAHPAAADFPGAVPAGAPRLTRTVSIDTRVPRWHSTGLYAAPGEMVRVTMPASAAHAGGYHVRVGAHTDGIWPRPDWTRMPEISRRFPVSAATTPVANAFGGLIYIEVPADTDLGRIDVQIAGAVAAPLFVLGETDPAVWRNEIRQAPAPWAEIAGRNMIVTTDSREIRELDDPAAVAETWDRILDLNAELAAWGSQARTSPERFVVDRLISHGYMHAGYPVMAFLDQQANLVNVAHLRSEGNWGAFHEVGHNHQNDDWTFDGTVEVTVNLFTLYVYERLVGIPVAENPSVREQAELTARYDFTNPDFELWKREPFLALVMYQQLQQAFGWEAYREVFATYRALPDAERPKSDDEKRDQWLVRFSQQVGRNLGPFFETWGVPTSRAARNSISGLPEWMPPNFPPRR